MTVWTPVEPISDEPAPKADYWPVFKIGDRVRIRLSGECQIDGPGVDYDDPSRIQHRRHHPDWMNGREGRVRDCVATGAVDCDTFPGHPIYVEFPAPDGTPWGSHFAAAELEAL